MIRFMNLTVIRRIWVGWTTSRYASSAIRMRGLNFSQPSYSRRELTESESCPIPRTALPSAVGIRMGAPREEERSLAQCWLRCLELPVQQRSAGHAVVGNAVMNDSQVRMLLHSPGQGQIPLTSHIRWCEHEFAHCFFDGCVFVLGHVVVRCRSAKCSFVDL